MIQHPNLREWEKSLKKILDDLDDILEDHYGQRYYLHPARPKRGVTANKAHDGLFNITAQFSLGLGSAHGKGYVIDIRLSTLEKVPDEIMNQIENLALRKIGEKLPEYFPGKDLSIIRDGNLLKLHGDLSLGKA